jgi:hypothetical protein
MTHSYPIPPLFVYCDEIVAGLTGFSGLQSVLTSVLRPLIFVSLSICCLWGPSLLA